VKASQKDAYAWYMRRKEEENRWKSTAEEKKKDGKRFK
jgi:hypothetical protein